VHATDESEKERRKRRRIGMKNGGGLKVQDLLMNLVLYKFVQIYMQLCNIFSLFRQISILL
jgi:hypothetical protein